ncbi:hypothetical protein BD770DRAFT_390979, partial [Pilaira anomala]
LSPSLPSSFTSGSCSLILGVMARRVGLMVLILVVISKKNIIIDCCVVVLIRCILVLGTSAGGPPRGLSWKTEFGNFEFGNFFSSGCKG